MRERSCLALVVIVVAALVTPLVFVLPSTAQFPWRLETIGPGAGVRNAAVDASGRVHAVYGLGIPVTELVYTVKEGGLWNPVRVDAGAYFDSSLALDQSNNPHIAYYRDVQAVNVEVRYARLQGTEFVNETIEHLSGTSPGPSIAVDRSGRPHVVYWNNGGTNNWRLRYAVRETTEWANETIATFNFVNTYERPSLALDSQGNPKVAVHTVGVAPLLYFRRDAGSWKSEVVDEWRNPPLTCCEVPSLALDSRDLPHIAYYNLSSPALRYARYDPSLGRWLTGNVYEQGSDITSPGVTSLALDWEDRPRISYFDTLALRLRYFYFDGTQWNMETPDTTAQTGNFNALALDPVGAPHILYTHWVGTTYSMMHAWQEWPDGVPPSSFVQRILPYWHTSGPLPVNATATDPGVGIANVTLWYRLSPDNATWTAWTPHGTLDTPPWSWTFPFPDGEGHYEFYSTAVDLAGNAEPPPAFADANAGYDVTPPVSAATPIVPYWHPSSPLAVNATARDDLSGVANVTLMYVYSPDSVTWGPWTPTSTSSAPPWSWTFPFPDGEGHYRFHTIARDVAGNAESAKTFAEAIAAYGGPPDYAPANPSPAGPVAVGLSMFLTLSLDIVNLGGASNRTASLAFFNASTPAAPFATFPIPVLARGQASSPFVATWASSAAPCTCKVTAFADYGNDLAESNETNNNVTWTIDVVPGPVTSLVVGLPNVTLAVSYVTSSTLLSFSVLDPGGAGIRNTTYRVDRPPWVNFTATGPFTLAGEGEHLLEWYSMDWAGNVETVRNATLRVDDTPPLSTLSIGDPKYLVGGTFVTSSTPLVLAATDGGMTPVGVNVTEYCIGVGPWMAYTAPITLVGEGLNTVAYRSTDRLGNLEAVQTLIIVVDDAPPTTTNAVGTPKHQGIELYVTSATPISLATLDGGMNPVGLALTEVRVGGGSWSPYTSSFALAGADGPRTIEYRSTDLLGNVEPARTLKVNLDDTPPTTTISPSASPFPAGTRFALSATDAGSGVNRTVYRVDDGTWTTYTTPFTVPDGEHVIHYFSVDDLSSAETDRTLVVPAEVALPIEFNWKPLVALVFAVAMLAAGAWSSRRAPWKGGTGRRAALKALSVFALPFVVLEGATGVASLFIGVLSIPPVLGPGTIVDSAILLVGLATAAYRGTCARGSDPESDALGTC